MTGRDFSKVCNLWPVQRNGLALLEMVALTTLSRAAVITTWCPHSFETLGSKPLNVFIGSKTHFYDGRAIVGLIIRNFQSSVKIHLHFNVIESAAC